MNMKRLSGLMCAAAMMLCLWGCWGEDPQPTEETTQYTLPTLNQALTPDEMLGQALTQTQGLDAFFVDYVHILGQERFAFSAQVEIREAGCTAETIYGSFSEDGTMEDPVYRYYEDTTCFEKNGTQVQMLSSESPYSLSEIFAQLPTLPEGLTDRYSGRTLHAIPGEDGSMRFQLSNLTPEEFETITGLSCGEGEATVVLTVAPEGYLSGVAFTAPDVQVTLTIQQATDREPLTRPDWAS